MSTICYFRPTVGTFDLQAIETTQLLNLTKMRVYSRILVKVCAVAMATGLVKNKA